MYKCYVSKRNILKNKVRGKSILKTPRFNPDVKIRGCFLNAITFKVEIEEE
jgi:hypothetical protein